MDIKAFMSNLIPHIHIEQPSITLFLSFIISLPFQQLLLAWSQLFPHQIAP